jgi:hypothetical protein
MAAPATASSVKALQGRVAAIEADNADLREQVDALRTLFASSGGKAAKAAKPAAAKREPTAWAGFSGVVVKAVTPLVTTKRGSEGPLSDDARWESAKDAGDGCPRAGFGMRVASYLKDVCATDFAENGKPSAFREPEEDEITEAIEFLLANPDHESEHAASGKREADKVRAASAKPSKPVAKPAKPVAKPAATAKPAAKAKAKAPVEDDEPELGGSDDEEEAAAPPPPAPKPAAKAKAAKTAKVAEPAPTESRSNAAASAGGGGGAALVEDEVLTAAGVDDDGDPLIQRFAKVGTNKAVTVLYKHSGTGAIYTSLQAIVDGNSAGIWTKEITWDKEINDGAGGLKLKAAAAAAEA